MTRFLAVTCLGAGLALLPGCTIWQALSAEPTDPVPITRPTALYDAEPVSHADTDGPKPPPKDPDARPADTQPVARQPVTQPVTQPTTVPVAHQSPPDTHDNRDDPARGQVVAPTLLVVNGEEISIDDILSDAGPRLAAIDKKLPLEQYTRDAGIVVAMQIRDRVHETLVVDLARREMKDNERGFVDRELKNIRKEMIARTGGSQKKLEAELEAQGTTVDDQLELLRRRMTMELLLRRKLTGAIVVGRRDLWNYYRRNIGKYTTPAKVQMRMIRMKTKRFLPQGVTEPTDEQRKAAADRACRVAADALSRVKAGEDFGEVAKAVSHGFYASEGGLWPMMERGNLREKKVEDIAFSLKQGEISNVIRAGDGCYVVKAHKADPGKVTPFADVQDEVEQGIRTQRQRQLREEYFMNLYEQATIMQSREFSRLAVMTAVERHRPVD